MLLLTVTEFRNNIAKYLQAALTERIAIKSKVGIFELNLSEEIKMNPSPSNDPYFTNPNNIKAVERGIEEVKHGKHVSWDTFRTELGL